MGQHWIHENKLNKFKKKIPQSSNQKMEMLLLQVSVNIFTIQLNIELIKTWKRIAFVSINSRTLFGLLF